MFTNLNMQNSMVMFSFFVIDQKYPFWANLVQKVKIVSLSWNFVPTLIWTCTIQWWCSFFVFDRKCPFWANLVQNKNCQFKLKFGTYTNSNMQNSVMMFTFLFLTGNTLFGQIWSKKIKIISLSWNLVTTLIRTCTI